MLKRLLLTKDKMLAYGRGRWAVSQKRIMIQNVEEGKIQILVSLIFLSKEVSFRVNGKEMS